MCIRDSIIPLGLGLLYKRVQTNVTDLRNRLNSSLKQCIIIPKLEEGEIFMDTIFTMETFISVVMIGYGIWMLFRSAQQLRTNIKLRNEYKNSHKDYEEVNVYTGFLIFFAIMMAAGIFLAFFPYVEDLSLIHIQMCIRDICYIPSHEMAFHP